ncbi:MAG: Phytanoyl-CoA dioxygenase, partial [uncultured Friedmanniella sp.]
EHYTAHRLRRRAGGPAERGSRHGGRHTPMEGSDHAHTHPQRRREHPDRRGHRGPLPRRAHAAGRGGGARAQALLRRDPPRRDPRLRRPRHAPVGDRGVRGGARPRVQGRRDRLRRAQPGRGEPALAPRLPGAARHPRGPAPQLARLQPHDDRRLRGHGAVRGRARDAVGRAGRLRARDVPAQVALPALRGARPAQDAEDGRHLGPLGAHHPPRHREPLEQGAPRARARRRRAGREQRRAPRPAVH